MIETLIEGGFFMIPLVLFSIINLGAVLDRWFAFRSYERIDNRSLRAQVIESVWNDQLDEAALACARTPGPVSAVLLAGVQAVGKYRRQQHSTIPVTVTVKEAMDDFTIHAISAVEKRFSIMSTIGNAAPLVGMLGTVTGMITSFEALADAGAADVAVGISEALITTAGGLAVALTAVLPYNYFSSKSDAVDLEIEETKAQFVDTVAEAGAGN